MRKLKALVIALAFIAGYSAFAYANEPTFETWTNKSDHIGKQSNPVRVLKLVRYAENGPNGPNISSRDVVVYSTVSDDGVTVALTTTSADATVAGIACTTIQSIDSTGSTSAASDIGRRNWGWIVVHGPVTAKVSAGGTNGNAVGDMWITSTDSGAITGVVSSTVTTSAGTNEVVKIARGRGGFFFNAASSSSTTAEVFVNLE